MGLALGRKPERETLFFFRVAAAGDEGHLVCEALAGALGAFACASL